MSARKAVMVCCDLRESNVCITSIIVSAPTIKAAREILKRLLWTRKNRSGDVCPACSAHSRRVKCEQSGEQSSEQRKVA